MSKIIASLCVAAALLASAGAVNAASNDNVLSEASPASVIHPHGVLDGR